VDHVAGPAGHTATLNSRSWRAAFSAGPVGIAWTYRRPTSVELPQPDGDAVRVRVIDHVIVVRTAAALLLLVARLIRRRQR
jgi:hypothetical protein